jgi:hypothetical protein
MYERGSSDWSNPSYGSGATYPGADARGFGHAPTPEPQVAYRSPSGEAFPALAAVEPVDVTGYPPGYYDTAASLPVPDAPVIYPMRNVAGRVAIVLGVLAILCTTLLFPLFPLGMLFGFGALYWGRKGHLRARYGFASNAGHAAGGVALGAVAVFLGVCFTAGTAYLFSAYDMTAAKDCVTASTSSHDALYCIADVLDAK